jgi:hypothetical protein
MNQQLFSDQYLFHLECLFDQCIEQFKCMKYVSSDFIETEDGIKLIVSVDGKEIYNNSIAFKSKRRMMEVFLFDAVKLFNK